MSQLKKGAILNYTTIFLTNIIGLLLTPFIIRSLGSAEYGLYTMIGAFVGYISVLDFGLNNTIIRFVAKYRAENDKKGEENFLALSFIMYGIISLFVFIIGGLLYYNINSIFGDTLSPEELRKAKIMFLILIFNLAITLPGGAFRGICDGYEEFTLPKFINIIRYLLRSGLIVAVLVYGGDSISIVVIDTIMNLLFIAGTAYIALKKLKVKIVLHYFDSLLLRTMWGYSIWIFVFTLVHQLRWQFGQVILGMNYATTLVAIYAVGITLGNYYGAFSSAISSLFQPKAMQMVVRNDNALILTETFVKISRLILFILLFIFGAFIMTGQLFMRLWVGEEFNDAYLLTVLIMAGLTLILSQGFANNLLQSKNKMKFRGIILLITTIAGLVSGWYYSLQYGALGLVVCTVIFMFVERFVMWWYYEKELRIDMKEYFKKTAPVFLSATLASIIAGVILDFIPNSDWMSFIYKVSVFSAIYMIFSYFILNRFEKDLILDSLRSLKLINKKV